MTSLRIIRKFLNELNIILKLVIKIYKSRNKYAK